MGRWSRRLADSFVRWLAVDPDLTWLDVGCGTGALASTICRIADPAAVVACDPSAAFVEHVRSRIVESRISAVVAGGGRCPRDRGDSTTWCPGWCSTSLPIRGKACGRCEHALDPGGVVSAYVWDDADRMQLMRVFWDEAVGVDAAARKLDEGRRFPVCRREALESVFHDAGLSRLTSEAVEIPTRFESFADYWRPFLGGTGPAPSYVASLDAETRATLRDRLERRLAPGPDSAVELVARAGAVRGSTP
jgi:SAM-dependent methyltransferase